MIDPVTLSVLKGRLEEIANEMDATLFRAAFSPVIAEARDASNAIYDAANGDTLIQGKSALPIFIGSMSFAVKAVIEKFGTRPDLADGDLYVLNDPYLGGTHLNDIKLVRPVFHNGRIVCWLASAGHWTDVGGNIPGNFNPVATETFQEGVRIPPSKLAAKGVLNDDLVQIMLAMSRLPGHAYGDLNGQLNALDLGARRLAELIAEYGAEALAETFAELRARAARMTRSYIAELPDGTYSFDDRLDNDGITDAPLTVAVDMTIAGETMTLDFSRSSPACAGPMNISYPSTVAACYVAIKHIFPDVPANAGCLETIRFVIPEGSILHARAPRPVCGYTETVTRVIDAIFGAMGKAAPERVNGAPSGTINAMSISGSRPGGDRWVLFAFFGGGQGGCPVSDGLSNGNPAMGMATIAPAEILEAAYPVMFTQWALRPDSAGAGRFRGGLGTIHELELLADAATLSHFSERTRSAPFGAVGGLPATPNVVTCTQDGTPTHPAFGGKLTNARLKKGDRFRFETPGGGGYGPPAERPRAAIERDVRMGYVSRAAARRDYGIDVPDADAAP
ncbi:MAG: hydantoinase B/oxoprolinase family protein [Rhodospirillales bacterium]